MIELQLDVGNTALKWRLRAQGQTLQQGHLQSRHLDVALLQQELPNTMHRVACANVAGKVVAGQLRDWCEQLGVACYMARSQQHFGTLRNGYVEPQQMGVDRWLAMVAARQHTSNAVCMVDCGSAVTVDYIAADGLHLGGYILPGQRLMVQSLVASTGNIRMGPSLATTTMSPAHDTWEAVGRGVRQLLNHGLRSLLQAAMVDGFELLLTGGDGLQLAADLQQLYLPNLVLDGLELVQQSAL